MLSKQILGSLLVTVALAHTVVGVSPPRCPRGYQLAGYGGECVDTNECTSLATQARCASRGAVCRNTNGSFQCVCRRGFRSTGKACVAGWGGSGRPNYGGATGTGTGAGAITCKLADGRVVAAGSGPHSKADGCNLCLCGNDGKLQCLTYMSCPSPPVPDTNDCKAPGGKTVKNGERAVGDDGCSTCLCSFGVLECVGGGCAVNKPQSTCTLASGEVVASGTGPHPAGDGCNTCSCENGDLVCTLMGCTVGSGPDGSLGVCTLPGGEKVPSNSEFNGPDDPNGCYTCKCKDGVVDCKPSNNGKPACGANGNNGSGSEAGVCSLPGGEKVPNNSVFSGPDDPNECYTCTCKDGVVDCKSSNNGKPACGANGNNGSGNEAGVCTLPGGQKIPNNTDFNSPDDPKQCNTCRCKDGVISCTPNNGKKGCGYAE